MHKNRLEAFSDGVFAIIITLLILDIRIPELEYEHLWEGLIAILPKVLSYGFSFFLVGVYWVFHHLYVDKVKKVDGTIVVYNMIHLLLLSFLTFPTSLMGKYPLTTIPILLYGSCLLLLNIIGLLTVFHIKRNPGLLARQEDLLWFKNQLPVFAWVNLPYAGALVIAYWFPIVSYAVFFSLITVVGVRVFRHMNAENHIM